MGRHQTKISRKTFIKHLSWLIALPFLYLAGLAFRQNARIYGAKDIRIPIKINEGVTFRDGIIIVKDKVNIQFLSAKCTHLGCNIHSQEKNELVCPCHGSRFALDGECLKGPAKESLQVLNYKIDGEKKEYVVKIS
jgi:Rieske Fe-S protein